ncbi:MAG TPA: xanthine dehydrogenase small subunit [Thermoanaerobaculia bacterium]|nr:xanthine dehydrogenase small subunit [Thermoanaerobaculia bacterium]
MAGSIFFYVNGKAVTASGQDAFETVANFLRYRLSATGTKLVCEEGDCGACSVLIGRLNAAGGIEYQAVNSCIQFVYQIAGTHIITVEGLRRGKDLHPVQEAMVKCHGAQCGFCTPGFVVTMSGMYETEGEMTEKRVRDALTGNLCRCTGYEPIIKAAMSIDPAAVGTLNDLYPPAEIVKALTDYRSKSIRVESGGRTFFAPTTVDEALRFKAENPSTVIVQGATDLGVMRNKRGYEPPFVMNLSRVAELGELTVRDNDLHVGATVTLSRLEPIMRERVPEFFEILVLFGAPQIKNAGTLAGNVANASPIADTLPFLYVMGARVELTSTAGSRLVDISSFYLGYKKLDLHPDEIITKIIIPLPRSGSDEILKLYKVSKRKNLDISTMTAAFRMQLSGSVMDRVTIALGGVAPTIVRLRKTEEFLTGRQMDRETLRQAGRIARDEISPISDVRGSAEFRSQLTENIFSKFYFETRHQTREEARA